MTPEDLWRGIDILAAANGFSPSGLARYAGLNPTTFNKNKRGLGTRHPRWIRLETLFKILAATDTSLEQFSRMMRRTSTRK